MTDETITQAQALARVEQLIRDTAAALAPAPQLELIPHGTGTDICLNPNEPAGKVNVNRAYWLHDVPRSENLSISRQVKAYWEAQGHVITGTGTGKSPNLSGESRPDRYILGLSWSEGDKLFLEATSTCVWPEGIAPK
ncbi:hypothetical protein [Nonomuraea typhae]|uniref:Uncharacterized protein n=1 Tax=Nonomuraea typhae TaxID=2603600 RepID=A0ABW7YTM1_9ACTN